MRPTLIKSQLFRLCHVSIILPVLAALALGSCATFSDAADDSGAAPSEANRVHAPISDPAPEDQTLPLPDYVDNEVALISWQHEVVPENQNQEQTKTRTAESPKILAEKKFACTQPGLLPTHPQEATEIEQRILNGKFDERRLSRVDRACRIGSTLVSSRHLQPCLVADGAKDILISDLYQDHCGHHYRAYWQKTFLLKDELPASTASLGRTLDQPSGLSAKSASETAQTRDEKSQPLLPYARKTHAVNVSRFFLLTETSAEDERRIQKLIQDASPSYKYDASSKIFTQIGKSPADH